jgi:4-oxalocrotonate tautomerase
MKGGQQMPIIKISVLEEKTIDQKRKVAAGITDVITKEFGVGPEAVRIIFNIMRKEDFALAGKLKSDS